MWIHRDLDEDTAYEAKIYNRPSIWGINEGRISKLNIYKYKDDKWDLVYEYDRGGEVGSIDPVILEKITSIHDGNGWLEQETQT